MTTTQENNQTPLEPSPVIVLGMISFKESKLSAMLLEAGPPSHIGCNAEPKLRQYSGDAGNRITMEVQFLNDYAQDRLREVAAHDAAASESARSPLYGWIHCDPMTGRCTLSQDVQNSSIMVPDSPLMQWLRLRLRVEDYPGHDAAFILYEAPLPLPINGQRPTGILADRTAPGHGSSVTSRSSSRAAK